MTAKQPLRAARQVRTFRTGRAALAAVTLVTVAAVVTVAVRGHRSPGLAEAPSRAASLAASAPTKDLCSDFASRAACSQVTLDGRAWRYTIHRAAQATRDTVIVDFGGPGVPVLADDYLTSFAPELPAVFDRYNVIAVDEPWSTRTVDPACRQALSRFSTAVSVAPTGPAVQQAAAVRTLCHVHDGGQWGFSPHTYPEVLNAVASKEDLSYTGFIGQSFGSMRLTYLQAGNVAHTLKWAVLSRPYPVGVPGISLAAQRSEAITVLMSQRTQATPAAQAPLSGAQTVSRFDTFSAEVELGYLAADGQAQAAADIAAGNSEVIHRLSDQLWQRYGDNDLSPAYLAQLDELCGPAHMPPPRSYQSPADILAAQLLPCAPNTKATPARLTLGTVPLCVASAARDAVAPVGPVHTALNDASTKTAWVNLDDPSHTGGTGIEQCLSRLGQQAG